ncbi:MAG: hypothetical protein LBR74_10170 [Eubacterium sp.]|jgi:hypothetical protein|nr:hypothetical protein [Eubacterium sp.]
MRVLNYNNDFFFAAHFQGGCYIEFQPLCDGFNGMEIKLPDNVSIVTVANFPENCMLIKQLEKNGIPYLNEVEFGREWSNTLKPRYIRKALNRVETEYVLILDAMDILLTGDLSDIAERFNQTGRERIQTGMVKQGFDLKLLFNATKSNYPKLLIDKVWGRDFRGEYRYLNAGACFGYTAYAKEFYKKADMLVCEDIIYNPNHSEQMIVRHIFKDCTDEVDFDYECKIFQTFSKSELMVLDGKNEIYKIL